MLSKRLYTAARVVQLRQASQPLRSVPLPLLFRQVRSYADRVVKVPEMAESISEGTLKQWSKQIGDYVEQDEEIATIETDKVGVGPSGSWPPGAHMPAHTYVADIIACLRSTLPSMRRRPALSRSSWPTRRIPSMSARIWCG